MNLIRDPWMPVKKVNGDTATVRPSELIDPSIVSFDATRRDLNGALMQFMIGLLQTACAPEDEDAWRDVFETKWTVDELSSKLSSFAPAFDVDSGDQRFMQSSVNNESKVENISGLFIDTPGQPSMNTAKFVPLHRWREMTVSDAALALFTLQINAPSGGAGHRVSVRGGGPITTLVDGEDRQDLWSLLWLNVLPQDEFLQIPGNHTSKEIFPWSHAPRFSPKGELTTPDDVNPLQVYWCAPRRILLKIENGAATGYATSPRGVNYGGEWRHPLTPYYFDKAGSALATRPKEGGFGYRHWLAFTLGDTESHAPALTVYHALRNRPEVTRIRVFGYAMNNAEPRMWIDGTMPLVHVESQRESVQTMIEMADQSARIVRRAVSNTGLSAPDLARNVWSESEADFYRQLQQLSDDAFSLEDWANTLRNLAIVIFDNWANTFSADANTLQKVAQSRRGLIGQLNKKMKDFIGAHVAQVA